MQATYEQRQEILFQNEYPTGREDENLKTWETLIAEKSVFHRKDSRARMMEALRTVRMKTLSLRRLINKNTPLGEEGSQHIHSALKPANGMGKVRRPVRMFLQFDDHDRLESLTFESNRFRVQENYSQ